MTYKDRPPPRKGPPWAHNSVGASVHNALAGWWRLREDERTVAASQQLLAGGWLTDGFSGHDQSARYHSWAQGLVTGYVRGLDPAAEPAGVERTVAAKTAAIAVSGRIDRLDWRPAGPGDGDLVVVDYKTGRRVPTADDARGSLALALYAIAAERTMRRECRRVELHHLPSGQVVAADHTAESLARHLRRAEAIAAECAAADAAYPSQPDVAFPPSPGPQCGWCDYRAACPEGRAASQQRRPWDGLADLDGSAGSAG